MILYGCVPKLITANHTKNGMSKKPKGLVIHIAEAHSLASIYAHFNNPNQAVNTSKGVLNPKASAHFGIDKNGAIWQFVDTNDTANAQGSGSNQYFSVEHVGFAGDELTERQILALTFIFRYLHDYYNFPLQLADEPGQMGLGYHSMGGKSWGHPACPGNKIINQRQRVVDDAKRLYLLPHR